MNDILGGVIMKVNGIEEVSKILAEFDFAKVKSFVNIDFSPHAHQDGCCGSVRIDIYNNHDQDPNPDTWDTKIWAEYIESRIQHCCDIYAKRYLDIYAEEYNIGKLTIVWCSSEEDEVGHELCQLCLPIEYDGFSGIYIPHCNMQIPLNDISIKSTEDVIKIVCACTELSRDDFVRVD